MGRFLTLDPWTGDVEHPLTSNPYLYALANSVNVLDPSGKQCLGCETAGEWAEFTLYSVYGIRLERGPSRAQGTGFSEPEKLLILDTVSDYANLLGGPAALRRNLALSTITLEWFDPSAGYDGQFNAIYLDGNITLPPDWYMPVLAMSRRIDGIWSIIIGPQGPHVIIGSHAIIGPHACIEEILNFPKGSLPTDEAEAQFVLAHEMGHAFRQGNPGAVINFMSFVDLPESSVAGPNPNPLIARNTGRVNIGEEVFADVLAAFLYSRALLNQQMLNWVQILMPGVLR
jgi:hypothetical protein